MYLYSHRKVDDINTNPFPNLKTINTVTYFQYCLNKIIQTTLDPTEMSLVFGRVCYAIYLFIKELNNIVYILSGPYKLNSSLLNITKDKIFNIHCIEMINLF